MDRPVESVLGETGAPWHWKYPGMVFWKWPDAAR